ncbi:AIPR family protein [Tsukamurella soli]|uniref:AIPR family protein n=1 Tax=Tsukamurella soli TaxID=644556 RepID=A0ABP8K2R2_9ACTN
MDPLIRGLFKAFRTSNELTQIKESDAFEVFVGALLLHDDILTQTELSDLLLDEGTIGVDIAILEVNGEVVSEPSQVSALCEGRNNIDVSLSLIQAKMSSTIDSSQVLNFGDIATKVVKQEVPDTYPKLQNISRALFMIFEDYATRIRTKPRVNLYFANTSGDASIEDTVVRERAENVRSGISSLGYIGDVSFDLYGASKLYEISRVKSQSNETDLVFNKFVNLPGMAGIDQAIVGVISIRELLKLVENTDGSLNEPVFYDNVRGFKGVDNGVNEQIISTLKSPSRSLLPVLNNGITVVAKSYSPKPGDAVSITGYQVVNGCQTSHCIYLSKDHLSPNLDSVFVPIRLVVTDNEDVATSIIRATNSQTAVNSSDMVALTNFQRRLETYYQQDQLDVGLTYERRAGQFYFRDVTRARTVSIIQQMRAVAATFLDLPHVAARYPQHLYEEVGERIFDDQHHLAPYVASAFAAYRLETAFSTNLEAEFKPIRYHILTAVTYRTLGGDPLPLNNGKVDSRSRLLVESLKKPDYVTVFRDAAVAVLDANGGSIPTRDRLKRQPFTTELIDTLRASN